MSEDCLRRVEVYHVSLWAPTSYNALLLEPGKEYRVASFDSYEWAKKYLNILKDLIGKIGNERDIVGIYVSIDQEDFVLNHMPTLDEIKEGLSYA